MNKNYVIIIPFNKINVSEDIMLTIMAYIYISVNISETLGTHKWTAYVFKILFTQSKKSLANWNWGIYYWYYIQKLVWTNIFSWWPAETVFPVHCILHEFDFYQFIVNLKQFKTSSYNLTYTTVALQNVITCQFNFESYRILLM